MLNISLADYGVGNLHSLKKALEMCNTNVSVVTDMKDLLDAECIAFPGVGAFDKTMEKLIPYRDEICDVLSNGIPAIGICIGTQILFNGSEEGVTPGLGFINGDVVKLKAKCIPHMGWNHVESQSELMEGVDNRYFYFAHSFHCLPSDASAVLGMTEYESLEFPVLFRKNNFIGSQFHPEKSSVSGLKFLSNFVKFAEGCL